MTNSKDGTTVVMVAALNALCAANVGPGSAKAKTFTYDRDGEECEGVEVTLFYSDSEAQGIEAATAATTTEIGVVHESPVVADDAPKGGSHDR